MAEPDTEEKQFSKGVEVLARWKDGIWYLANVQEVEEKRKRCQVVFEDGTVTWLFYKDLQSSLTQLDLQCMVCHDGTSKKPNEIVLCDQCEQGYHQKCHIPEITSDMLQTTAEWFCRQCVFGNSAKAGGAAKQGPDAEALRSLKRSLPYNLKALHWDNKHRSNKEDLYCYCGGPGDWSCKMLQCNKCEQWFHEACIQCLNHPLLAGDRFYVFVCGVCNEGKEYIKRMKLRWVEVAHFALYYLSSTYKKKFHNADDVIDFVDDHWDTFQLGESTRASRREAHEAIREVLRSTSSRFKQSSNDPVLYALKSRSPPQPPKLTEPLPPPGTEVEDEVGTSGIQQGKRGKKRRLGSPDVGSSTDDQSEVKSRRTNKGHELRSQVVENRAAEKTPRGKQKGSKSKVETPQGEGEDVPMFPSPSMFKYLYSSSSKSPESDKSPSTQESSSSVTCTSTPSTDTVTDQQLPKINFVPDPVRKDTSEEKTVFQTDVAVAPSKSDSDLHPQPFETYKEDTAENQGRGMNIEIKSYEVMEKDVEKGREIEELGNKCENLNESTESDELEEVDAPPGSHIVSHVMEFEEPMAVETETGSDVKGDIQEEQITSEVVSTDGLQTKDVEDYVVISRASDAEDCIETMGSGQSVDQSSRDTERSDFAAEGVSEKAELENRVEEEESSGQDNEFVLMMEESLSTEDDSFKEAEEEPDTNANTNGHVAEIATSLDKDTNGVIEQKQNGVTDKSSDSVTEEKSSTDVERSGEDGGMQITCHATEEICHIKSRDEDVRGITTSQMIHGHLEEGKSCAASAAVGSFESKPFTTDIDHEMFPVEYQMEEK